MNPEMVSILPFGVQIDSPYELIIKTIYYPRIGGGVSSVKVTEVLTIK